jgi:hypothetical protein
MSKNKKIKLVFASLLGLPEYFGKIIVSGGYHAIDRNQNVYAN